MPKQETRMFQYAGASRFAYNWALAKKQENYKNGGKFISDVDLRKEFTQRRKTEEYAWLNHVSNNVTKQAIKDACHSIPSFYQDNVKIKFTDTHVKVEGFTDSKKKNKQKLNLIKLAEHGRMPAKNTKYTNPRIKYDGIDWWITVGIECEVSASVPNNHGVGIDLGIKDLAVCSDGKNDQNINKTQKVKK